jgi:hypothetical protein
MMAIFGLQPHVACDLSYTRENGDYLSSEGEDDTT